MNMNLSPLDISLIAVCAVLVVLIIYLIITVRKLSSTISSLNILLRGIEDITQENTQNINSIMENFEQISTDAKEITNKVNNSIKGIEHAIKTPLDDPNGVMQGAMKVKKYYHTFRNVMFAAMVVKDFLSDRKKRKRKKTK